MPQTGPNEAERLRLEEAVAEVIDMGDRAHARQAATLFVAQMAAEADAVAVPEAVEEARSRYFTRIDPEWIDFLADVAHGVATAEHLAKRLRAELTPRLPVDDVALRVHCGIRCRVIAGEMFEDFCGRIGRGEDPGRVKHLVCRATWVDIIGYQLDRDLPRIRLIPGQVLPDSMEKRAAEALQLIAFAELVDLRLPERTDVVRRATPPIPSRPAGSSYKDDVGPKIPGPRRGRGPIRTRLVKPRQQRRLTSAEEEALEAVAGRLQQAVGRARQALIDNKSPYVEAINHLADGQYGDVPEETRTRAYYRLGCALNGDGFAYGKRVEDPASFLGARHTFPPGVDIDVDALNGRQADALRHELTPTKSGDGRRSRSWLRAIAHAANYKWPAAHDSAESWGEVEQLLRDLRAARQIARTGRAALYMGDPFSARPNGLPARFAKPRSTVRQAQAGDDSAALFEYGRVIVLPDDAVPIEALARKKGVHHELLPAPLDKVHVGEWYFFPHGGIDVQA